VSSPHEKIINSTLENNRQAALRRWHTDSAHLHQAPRRSKGREIAEAILENHEGNARGSPPRVHFTGFNDWSLNISVYAWYFPGDFWKYQAWRRRSASRSCARFRERGSSLPIHADRLPDRPGRTCGSAASGGVKRQVCGA